MIKTTLSLIVGDCFFWKLLKNGRLCPTVLRRRTYSGNRGVLSSHSLLSYECVQCKYMCTIIPHIRPLAPERFGVVSCVARRIVAVNIVKILITGARARFPKTRRNSGPGWRQQRRRWMAGWLAGGPTGRMARGRVQEPPREEGGRRRRRQRVRCRGGRNPAPRPTFMYVWRRLWRRRRRRRRRCRRRISLYACGKPNLPAPRPDATAYNNNNNNTLRNRPRPRWWPTSLFSARQRYCDDAVLSFFTTYE